jgi:single-strand DNA-binding protein
MLIGNLTRDPELRYTPQGTAVCTMGLATNRTWVTDNGDKKEETEFHRIVAWNKLAELCSQLLFKGRRVYVEGRLQTRQWTGQDGQNRQATEIVIEDMLVLDSKRQGEEGMATEYIEEMPAAAEVPAVAQAEPKPKGRPKKTEVKSEAEEVAEDIPF